MPKKGSRKKVAALAAAAAERKLRSSAAPQPVQQGPYSALLLYQRSNVRFVEVKKLFKDGARSLSPVPSENVPPNDSATWKPQRPQSAKNGPSTSRPRSARMRPQSAGPRKLVAKSRQEALQSAYRPQELVAPQENIIVKKKGREPEACLESEPVNEGRKAMLGEFASTALPVPTLKPHGKSREHKKANRETAAADNGGDAMDKVRSILGQLERIERAISSANKLSNNDAYNDEPEEGDVGHNLGLAISPDRWADRSLQKDLEESTATVAGSSVHNDISVQDADADEAGGPVDDDTKEGIPEPPKSSLRSPKQKSGGDEESGFLRIRVIEGTRIPAKNAPRSSTIERLAECYCCLSIGDHEYTQTSLKRANKDCTYKWRQEAKLKVVSELSDKLNVRVYESRPYTITPPSKLEVPTDDIILKAGNMDHNFKWGNVGQRQRPYSAKARRKWQPAGKAIPSADSGLSRVAKEMDNSMGIFSYTDEEAVLSMGKKNLNLFGELVINVRDLEPCRIYDDWYLICKGTFINSKFRLRLQVQYIPAGYEQYGTPAVFNEDSTIPVPAAEAAKMAQACGADSRPSNTGQVEDDAIEVEGEIARAKALDEDNEWENDADREIQREVAARSIQMAYLAYRGQRMDEKLAIDAKAEGENHYDRSTIVAARTTEEYRSLKVTPPIPRYWEQHPYIVHYHLDLAVPRDRRTAIRLIELHDMEMLSQWYNITWNGHPRSWRYYEKSRDSIHDFGVLEFDLINEAAKRQNSLLITMDTPDADERAARVQQMYEELKNDENNPDEPLPKKKVSPEVQFRLNLALRYDRILTRILHGRAKDGVDKWVSSYMMTSYKGHELSKVAFSWSPSWYLPERGTLLVKVTSENPEELYEIHPHVSATHFNSFARGYLTRLQLLKEGKITRAVMEDHQRRLERTRHHTPGGFCGPSVETHIVVTVHKAEFFQEREWYVRVKKHHKQLLCTEKSDSTGAPAWDASSTETMIESHNHTCLVVDVFAKSKFRRDDLVGTNCIPLALYPVVGEKVLDFYMFDEGGINIGSVSLGVTSRVLLDNENNNTALADSGSVENSHADDGNISPDVANKTESAESQHQEVEDGKLELSLEEDQENGVDTSINAIPEEMKTPWLADEEPTPARILVSMKRAELKERGDWFVILKAGGRAIGRTLSVGKPTTNPIWSEQHTASFVGAHSFGPRSTLTLEMWDAKTQTMRCWADMSLFLADLILDKDVRRNLTIEMRDNRGGFFGTLAVLLAGYTVDLNKAAAMIQKVHRGSFSRISDMTMNASQEIGDDNEGLQLDPEEQKILQVAMQSQNSLACTVKSGKMNQEQTWYVAILVGRERMGKTDPTEMESTSEPNFNFRVCSMMPLSPDSILRIQLWRYRHGVRKDVLEGWNDVPLLPYIVGRCKNETIEVKISNADNALEATIEVMVEVDIVSPLDEDNDHGEPRPASMEEHQDTEPDEDSSDKGLSKDTEEGGAALEGADEIEEDRGSPEFEAKEDNEASKASACGEKGQESGPEVEASDAVAQNVAKDDQGDTEAHHEPSTESQAEKDNGAVNALLDTLKVTQLARGDSYFQSTSDSETSEAKSPAVSDALGIKSPQIPPLIIEESETQDVTPSEQHVDADSLTVVEASAGEIDVKWNQGEECDDQQAQENEREQVSVSQEECVPETEGDQEHHEDEDPVISRDDVLNRLGDTVDEYINAEKSTTSIMVDAETQFSDEEPIEKTKDSVESTAQVDLTFTEARPGDPRSPRGEGGAIGSAIVDELILVASAIGSRAQTPIEKPKPSPGPEEMLQALLSGEVFDVSLPNSLIKLVSQIKRGEWKIVRGNDGAEVEVDSKNFNEFHAAELAEMREKSMKIQAIIRGFLQRRKYKKMVVRHRAAVKIQSIARMFLSRMHNPHPWSAAARQLQAYCRGFLVRAQLKKMKETAAVNIQRIARGFMARAHPGKAQQRSEVADTVDDILSSVHTNIAHIMEGGLAATLVPRPPRSGGTTPVSSLMPTTRSRTSSPSRMSRMSSPVNAAESQIRLESRPDTPGSVRSVGKIAQPANAAEKNKREELRDRLNNRKSQQDSKVFSLGGRMYTAHGDLIVPVPPPKPPAATQSVRERIDGRKARHSARTMTPAAPPSTDAQAHSKPSQDDDDARQASINREIERQRAALAEKRLRRKGNSAQAFESKDQAMSSSNILGEERDRFVKAERERQNSLLSTRLARRQKAQEQWKDIRDEVMPAKIELGGYKFNWD